MAAGSFDDASITDIRVLGNTTIAGDDIISWLKVRKNDRVGDVRLLLDRDFKEIWRTEKFKDVQFSLQPLADGNAALMITVVEKPVITVLAVKGNKEFNEKELLEKSELKTGTPYDEFSARRAAAKIEAHYKEKEFFQVEVTIAAEPQGKGVAVEFQVKEGMKIKVAKITFTGLQAFDDGKIKGFMDTKESGWFTGGTFKEETFKDDLKKILSGYAKEGYLKARLDGVPLQDLDAHFQEIKAKALNVDSVKKEMTIQLVLTEGIQYKLNQMNIKGNIIFSEEELLRRTDLKSGDLFNRATFETDLQQIRMAYSEKGYIYADIAPEMEYRDDNGKVDVNITIKENTIARIEKIEIRGNTETKDKVIRRELTVKPGQAFDTREIQRSQEKVMNLGFFQNVKPTTEPGSTPGEQVLVFEVEERHTGTISLGAGYSSVDYLMGYLQLTQANLFGNGQSVSLQWEEGQLRQSYQMSFTEPYLFDSPVSFGVDIWDTNRSRGYNGQNYTLTSQGGDIRLGKRFDEVWKGYFTYKLESDEYSNLDSSLLGTYHLGRSDTSSVTPSLVYDSRDNIFDATTGMNHRLSVEIAGGPLGGDNNFLSWGADTSYYIPLIWRLVLALHGTGNYVYGYNYGVTGYTDVPPAKRFRAGGTDTVRGYGEGEFGPSLGGQFRLVTNIELHYPIIGPLKGVAFFDAGNAWDKISDYQSYPSLQKGVGLGIRLTIPGTVILIRFDFGYPLDPEPNKAQTMNYHFNIGNIF
ncbi:MAG: outer membrane protein assembly factor BamA [Candidatus Firestonebacteria bacterium]|nr:outer membrane protein assembly factor BamA [Candidatus Firestonebacteria bacterium]